MSTSFTCRQMRLPLGPGDAFRAALQRSSPAPHSVRPAERTTPAEPRATPTGK